MPRGEWGLLIGLWLLVACSGTDQAGGSGAGDSVASPAGGVAGDSVRAPAGGVAADSNLVRATERLIAFLRAEAPLPDGLLADSVTLMLAPEGGGSSRVAAAAELRDRAAWQVDGRSLLPPSSLQRLTLHPGSHVNCRTLSLGALYPELARRPHVGALLAAAAGESCLQTWNATFVFDQSRAAPRLTAVVYDQWEW